MLVETQGYARYVYVPYRFTTDDSKEGRTLRLFEPFSVQVPAEFYPKL